jgi:hypothetical protein
MAQRDPRVTQWLLIVSPQRCRAHTGMLERMSQPARSGAALVVMAASACARSSRNRWLPLGAIPARYHTPWQVSAGECRQAVLGMGLSPG